MRCDTCQRETDMVMRVVVAKGYNRSLARPLFNCPTCYELKERAKSSARQTTGLREAGKTSAREER